MTVEPCPDEATLLAFVSSELSEAEVADVASHLDRCPVCTELVVALTRQRRGPARRSRYTIRAPIAEGGMGVILHAVDEQLGRSVALKTVRDNDATAMARFQREISVTARLEHPSIVPVYDGGRLEDGTPFYVMRRVAGKELEVCLREAASLNDRLELVPAYIDLVGAVAYAHAEGIIHRDLKPRNVLVGDYGETVVLDWGLAKGVDETTESTSTVNLEGLDDGADLTQAGTVIGTRGYVAPEVRRGKPASTRSDVYSLGVILRRLLTGEHVLEMEGRAFDPGSAPGDLAAIARRACARTAQDRYADAGALVRDLRRFQAGRLVEARHYGWVDRVVRFVRRNLAVVGTVGLATSIVITTTAWTLSRVTTARDEARSALEFARTAEARATEEKESAEALIDFALLDLSEELRAAGRSDALARIAERVDEYYERRADTETGGRALRQARAVMIEAGILTQRGKWDAAEARWLDVGTLLERARTSPEVAAEAERLQVRVLAERARVSTNAGRTEEGIAMAGEAVAMARQLPPSPETSLVLGDALLHQVEIYSYAGDDDTAGRAALEATQLAVQQTQDPNGRLIALAARANSFLGRRSISTANFDDARTQLLRAIELAEDYRRLRPNNVGTLELLATDRYQLGQLEASIADLDAALPHLGEAARNFDIVRTLRPDNVFTALKLSDARTSLAAVLLERGAAARAEVVLLEDVEELSALHDASPSLAQVTESLGFAEVTLARTLAKLDRSADAGRMFERGLERLSELSSDEMNPGSKSRLAYATLLAAWFYIESQQPERALPALRSVRKLRVELAGDDLGASEGLGVAEVDVRMGLAHAQLGEREKARQRLRLALAALARAKDANLPRDVRDVVLRGCEELANAIGARKELPAG